jgi:hypothetical protein
VATLYCASDRGTPCRIGESEVASEVRSLAVRSSNRLEIGWLRATRSQTVEGRKPKVIVNRQSQMSNAAGGLPSVDPSVGQPQRSGDTQEFWVLMSLSVSTL